MTLKEKFKKYKTIILPIVLALGITPAAIIRYVKKVQQDFKHIVVSNKVYNAAFRGLYRLDYTGKVDMDERTWDVEIRSTFTYDEYKEDMVLVEWIFIIDGGDSEMYEAIYSGVWRGYHFMDKNNKYQWVYNLEEEGID